MLPVGKATINGVYDNVNVMLYTSLDGNGRCYCQGCDGCNALVTDVKVTYFYSDRCYCHLFFSG